ncbi:MAG: LacI family transcriptional regulator [Bifidobacteriaceae bacterium]|jgi:LacI family transcriptional regulator|nr:LacI family transcriptional regulator [Bifidobacteriaceae bacterium]
MQSNRVTIVDVAREAHVSVGTASNVLNRPQVVAESTRRKVERAIDKLGFVPSRAARLLRSGNPTCVGAILLDIRNPFYTDVARGIEERLGQDTYSLLIGSSDSVRERESRYLKLFEAQGVAGIIAATVDGSGKPYRQLIERGLNVVLLESSFEDLPVSSVRVNNTAGAQAAVRHLVELGFDQVVMLNGPHRIRQCAERLAGARQALADHGLGPDSLTEVQVDQLNSMGGEQAARRWLENNRGPAAFFCVNDMVAIGLQRALTYSGGYSPVCNPIVGFDDIGVVADRAVPITSVRQPTYELGHRAADLLLTTHAGQPTEHVTFVPELVIRASTLPR